MVKAGAKFLEQLSFKPIEDQESHQIMRSWRVILFFDCLNDFNLGTLSNFNLNSDERTPRDNY
jgi:hypothetical protein